VFLAEDGKLGRTVALVVLHTPPIGVPT